MGAAAAAAARPQLRTPSLERLRDLIVRKSVGVVVLIVEALLFGLAYVSWVGSRSQHLLSNADSLGLPMIARDLVRDPGNLFAWTWPSVPSFFPDMLVTTLLSLVMPRTEDVMVVYGVLEATAFFGLSIWMLARVHTSPVRTSLTSIIPAFLLVFAVGAGLQWRELWPYGQRYFLLAITIAHHFGAALVSIALLAMGALSAGISRRRGIAMLSLATLTLVSDLLFVMQFVVPLLFTALILRHATKAITDDWVILSRAWTITVGVVAVLAVPVYDALSPYLQAGSGYHGVFTRLQGTADALTGAGYADYPFAFLLLLLVLMMSWRVGTQRHRAPQAFIHDAWLRFELFCLLVWACNLALMFVTDSYADRYIALPVYLSLLWLVGAVARYVEVLLAAIPRWALRASGPLPVQSSVHAVVLAGLAAMFWMKPVPLGQILDFSETDAVAQCLPQGADVVSEYWLTKPLMLRTDATKFQVLQLRPDGRAYSDIFNCDWAGAFLAHTNNNNTVSVVMKGMNQELFLSRYGTPLKESACSDIPVWTYDKAPFVRQALRDLERGACPSLR